MNRNTLSLKLGDVVIINSPNRLFDAHKKKGHISGYSYEDDSYKGDEITAYSVTIDGECWFVFPNEIVITGEYIDPNINMTDEYINVLVDNQGRGRFKE